MAAEKNIMRSRQSFEKREPKEFDEKVIEIARVSRVVKGGRRIRFRALVVLGDHKGRIGMGVAKANEVAEAVKKAVAKAKKNIVNVPIINGTIPHEIIVKHGGAKVMLKPATLGTSIVAGGSVRSVAELAGISDLLAKSMGSSNKINNVTATIKALSSFNQSVVDKIIGFNKKAEARDVAKVEVVVENKPEKIEPEEKIKETKPEEKKIEEIKQKVVKKKVKKEIK